jgi:hypothetical protein
MLMRCVRWLEYPFGEESVPYANSVPFPPASSYVKI